MAYIPTRLGLIQCTYWQLLPVLPVITTASIYLFISLSQHKYSDDKLTEQTMCM